MLPLSTLSSKSLMGSPKSVSPMMMLYPTVTVAKVAAAEAELRPKIIPPSGFVYLNVFWVATEARYFPPMEMVIIKAATFIVSKSLKKTVTSINIPTLIRKKGIKIAFPTNSTRFIKDDVRGISLFNANPARKAPIIASIPANSASSAAR